MSALGELIALSRELKGWTLRDLERASGISNALISQIETGKVKDPGFSTVIKISGALGLSIDRAARTVFAVPAHDWFLLNGMKCCRVCCNVWNETSDTRPCKGPHTVGPRTETAQKRQASTETNVNEQGTEGDSETNRLA